MKRLAILCVSVFFAVFCCDALFSQNPWTVQSVPNTRLQSNEIHVSDPDGFLSDSVEMEINTALCTIRDQADVFVVTLASIGDAEPKRFATQLFNYWGIGDAETDNGVLLLFVENQHALEFETGYGAEATLTDAQCQRIFTKSIVPFFRAGDYESGLCAGVAEIVNLYSGEIPMNLMPALPFVEPEDEGHDDFSVIFGLFAMVMFAMPWVGFFFWLKNRDEGSDFCNPQAKTEDGIIYIDSLKTTWSGSPWEGKGCLGGMMIGLSYVCQHCGDVVTKTIVILKLVHYASRSSGGSYSSGSSGRSYSSSGHSHSSGGSFGGGHSGGGGYSGRW